MRELVLGVKKVRRRFVVQGLRIRIVWPVLAEANRATISILIFVQLQIPYAALLEQGPLREN